MFLYGNSDPLLSWDKQQQLLVRIKTMIGIQIRGPNRDIYPSGLCYERDPVMSMIGNWDQDMRQGQEGDPSKDGRYYCYLDFWKH